ncbi:fam-c protein [Plasmodium berghei]|uniref:Fam-c protein n=2 Tax=Plasmodium berghei TaxID=5821 RepID=A0A509ARS4_PLABA|nr:fam-c protein [Plasmodium berghei ANKA]CXI58904.1 fam-c protein [Plasmodium berghei]SCM23395.1 fam-c protein [Plasmodium berghei]SCN26571.1 fam-c protein [Plasmodium berghei]SCO60833.1 fam-c protein [Plasmodium berghei]SCO62809.1 fam-c protein [Plasmodium berghei]|eukprot:XP_034422217.1 fam-c protein [Plasmodium berghei ANKA]
MNKRIFSLVCITLYVLLAVPMHCSEQKVSGLGNKIIRTIKKIHGGNEQNGIESKRETQLNNSNSRDPKDDKDNKRRDYNKEMDHEFWMYMNFFLSD